MMPFSSVLILRNFYPRPPRGGRPPGLSFPRDDVGISIHALREEGDLKRDILFLLPRYFYPRPPRGGRPRNADRAKRAE